MRDQQYLNNDFEIDFLDFLAERENGLISNSSSVCSSHVYTIIVVTNIHCGGFWTVLQTFN